MNDELKNSVEPLSDADNAARQEKAAALSAIEARKESEEKSPAANGESKSASDDSGRISRRMFVIRIIAAAVGVLGVVLLISGIALRRLDEQSRRTPEKAQMPEEYIEEFFSDENFTPNIEDYIEPEA